MGISEVYIIGLDFKFDLPKDSNVTYTPNQSEWIQSFGEKNHFHPDYRKPGEMWAVPRLDVQYLAFQKAKEVYDSKGRKIYNASRFSLLDVFPKITLEDALGKKI